MRLSARGKRHARHQKKLGAVSLNLVSLMDIFTILVFFLLINSGDVEILQTDDSLELPSSESDNVPEETLVVLINRDAIVVSGRPLVELAGLEFTETGEIQALAEELQYQASRKPELSEREEEEGLAVTIMGDKDTPYSLLKHIIQTCAAYNFRDIALAVNQIPGPSADDLITPSDAEALTDGLSLSSSSNTPIPAGG